MDRTPDGVILFEVDKVSTLTEEERFSSEVNARGVPWRAGIHNDGRLSVSLYCMHTQTTLWNADVLAEFNLVHSDRSKNVSVVMTDTAQNLDNSVDCDLMVSDEFGRKGFVRNDTVTVEIRFWIKDMRGFKNVPRFNFADSNDPFADATLVINGEKVYVNKQFLSLHSPVFNAMFYGDFAEKNKEEIELKDIDREEFIEMLHVIYPSNKNIEMNSAEFLLKLADRFQIVCLIERVEKFLIGRRWVIVTEKLRLADKYRLFGLQENALLELKTKQDFEAVRNSYVYADLSDALKAQFFERLLLFCNMYPVTKKSRLDEWSDSMATDDCSGFLRFEIDNVSTGGYQGRFSTTIEVGGVPWRANVSKEFDDGQDHLYIYLGTDKNQSRMWSIDVNSEHILVHSNRNKNVSYKTTSTFQHNSPVWGLGVMFWEDLTKKGFIKDDKITVEIRFTITNMKGFRAVAGIDFTNSKEPCHDIALVIDGEKIYVSKQYLSLHSPVFKAMFYGDFAEKNKDQIELKDVDKEEFLEMLRVIYPSSKKITDDNVHFLLKLGDRFQIKVWQCQINIYYYILKTIIILYFLFVLDLAEEHLMSWTELEIASKLLLSDQFRLVNLQNQCLSELSTPQDFKAIKESSLYSELSDTTIAALFDRSIETTV